jgi:hypothetical protein
MYARAVECSEAADSREIGEDDPGAQGTEALDIGGVTEMDWLEAN